MSHLRTIGAGAEAMNDRKYAEVEEFFHKHNVQAKIKCRLWTERGMFQLHAAKPDVPAGGWMCRYANAGYRTWSF